MAILTIIIYCGNESLKKFASAFTNNSMMYTTTKTICEDYHSSLFFSENIHLLCTTSFLRKRQFDFGEPWVCGSINFWDGVSVQDCSHNSIPKMHTRVVVHVLSSWKRAIFVHSFFLHKKKKSFLYKHFLISVCSSKQCTFCSLC